MQDTLYVKIDKENILQEIIVDLPKYEFILINHRSETQTKKD